MTRKGNAIETVALFFAAYCNLAQGQSPSQTTLTVDLQNVVEYQDDNADPAKFATNPNVTPSVTFKNFGVVTLIGDIVAVNGQPAKGTYVGRSRGLVMSPAPTSGGAIADVTRTALREHMFEILQSDGTAVGTIMSLGFSGGAAPPGAPSTDRANWAIVGGTGAFLGARGTVGGTGGASRAASMDNRRKNGGTAVRFIPSRDPHVSAANRDYSRRTGRDPLQRFHSGQCVQAGSRRGGFVAVRHRPRPYYSGRRPRPAVSIERPVSSQFAGSGDGEWETRRDSGLGRLARRCRWISGKLSHSSGRGKGTGHHPA